MDNYNNQNPVSVANAVSAGIVTPIHARSVTINGTTYEGDAFSSIDAAFAAYSTAAVQGCSFGTRSTIGGGKTAVIDKTGFKTIDSSENGGAVCNNGAASIYNSTFTEGNAVYGGAVYSDEKTQLSVTGGTFENNTASFGGAIFGGGNALVTLSQSSFRGNTATSAGGVFYNLGGTARIEGCVFHSNAAGGENDGGVIFCAMTTAVLVVETSTFSSNASGGWGGAVRVAAGTASFAATEFSNNSAGNGGAIYNSGSIGLYNNCLFNGNNAGEWGGAVYNATERNMTVTGVTFTGNKAKSHGGAIYSAAFGTVNVSDSSFSSNTSGGWGGAIFASTNAMTYIKDSKFSGNTSADNGGAFSTYRSSTATVVNSDFTGNMSDYGGAVFANYDAAIGIKGSTFSGNAARYGGVIYSNTGVVVEKSHFSSNMSTASGGAIYSAAGTVTESTFIGNGAGDNGGAICNTGDTMTISGSAFTDNRATGSGGAIYNEGTAVIFNNAFTRSTAGTAGGAIYNAGTATIANNTFAGNSAGTAGGAIYNTGTAVITDCVFTTKTDTICNSGGSLTIGGTIWTAANITSDSSSAITVKTGTKLVLDVSVYSGSTGKELLTNFNTMFGESQSNLTMSVNVAVAQSTGMYSLATGVASLSQKSFSIMVDGDWQKSFTLEVNGKAFLYNGKAYSLVLDNTGKLSLAVKESIGVVTADGTANTVVIGGLTYTGTPYGQNRMAEALNNNTTVAAQNVTLAGFTISSEKALVADKIRMSGNSASKGGAICNSGTATIIGSSFTANTADYGGAIYNENGIATIADSVFATETDTIYNKSGVITFTGTNDINASIRGDNGLFVARNAVLNFSGAELSGGSVYATGNSSIIFDGTAASAVKMKLAGFSTVGFVADAGTSKLVSFDVAQDFSGSVVSVTCDLTKIQAGKSYTVAAGSYAFAAQQRVALNGVSGVANSEIIVSSGTYMLGMDGKFIWLLRKHSNPIAINITASKTSWTNENVNITVNVTDGGWGIANKEYSIDGNTWQDYTAPVAMTKNGTFSFRVTDNLGGVTESSYVVKNIDKVPPTITITPSTTSWTNQNVTVSAKFTDNLSGIATKEYRINDGSWTTYTTEITMTANGTVSFRATDKAGNATESSHVVGNIDKIAPTITITPSTTSWTNQDVIVSADITDDLSGIKSQEYRINGGSWTTYVTGTGITMSSNGTISFRATDKAGNTATSSYKVTNIDKVAPTITITPSTTSWTNRDVTVSAAFAEKLSGIKSQEYSINGGSWTAYTTGITMSSNGTVYFRATDNAGNTATSSHVVTIIDKVAPTIAISPSTEAWTNRDVTISAKFADNLSGIKLQQYRINGGSWKTYVSDVVMTANGTISFRATDNAGNTATSFYEVTNIDKVAPTITITPSATSWTNKDVTISAKFTDNLSGIKSQEYRIDDGSWTAYTTGITMSTNGTVFFRATDNADNATESSYKVTNIDKVAPTITIKPSTTSWTNKNVTVSAVFADNLSGIATKEYSINGGTWKTYTTGVTMSANGTVSFRATDKAGNATESSHVVGNIDKIAPTITITPSTTSWTNQDVIVSADITDDLSGIKSQEYRINGGSWTTYVTGTGITMSSNGTISFRATDKAGNTATSSYKVTNIDKVAPTITITPSTTSWTNRDVTVSAVFADNLSGIKSQEYRINDGSWTTYTAGITMSSNGTVSFRATDKAGNTAESSHVVGNIDKIAPTITITPSTTSWTNQDVTVSAVFADDLSGIATKKYSINGGSWKTYVSGVVMTANGTISFRATDKAGNEKISSYEVTNIDKIAPTITITPSTTSWTNQDVTVSAVFADDLSGIKSQEYRINDGTWTTYATEITMSTNGTVSFRATDNAGNTAESSHVVKNIDKIAPTITIKPSTTSWTNKNVTVSAVFADNLSGIATKEYRINDGSWTTYTTGITMSANGTVSFRATDKAGNATESSHVVGNIDKIAPTITITPSTTSWTNQDVTVSAVFADDLSGIKSQEYRINGGKWTTYESGVVMTANGTVSFRATDKAGNEKTSVYEVKNIDKVAPTITITPSTTSWTNQDVTVSAVFADKLSGIKSQEYRINDGAWTTYATGITMSANGTVSFRATDNAGNMAESSHVVGNIDKIAPTITVTMEPEIPTIGGVTLTAEFFDNLSGIASSEYKMGNGAWKKYAKPVEVLDSTTVSFRALDKAGNETIVSKVVETISKRKEKIVVDVDETATSGFHGVKALIVSKSVTYRNDYGIAADRKSCSVKLAAGASVAIACILSATSGTGKTTIAMKKNAALDVANNLSGIAKLTTGEGATVNVTGDISGTMANDSFTIGKTNSVLVVGNLDFGEGKNKVKIGAGSTVGFVGMTAVQSLTLMAGARDKEKNQRRTVFSSGDIIGTVRKDKIKLGNFSTFAADSIDLKDGESSIVAGGAGSKLNVSGKVSGINSFKTGNGKDTSEDGAMMVEIGTLSLDGAKKNMLSIGKFGTATFGNLATKAGVKANVSIGANAVVNIGSPLANINKLMVAAGAKYKDAQEIQRQGYTMFDIGSASITGTTANDALSFGNFGTVTMGAIDLLDGKNTLSIGGQDVEFKAEDVRSISSLKVAAGKSAELNARVTMGDIEFSQVSNRLDIGAFSTFTAGMVSIVGRADQKAKATVSLGKGADVGIDGIYGVSSLKIASGKRDAVGAYADVATFDVGGTATGTIDNDIWTFGNGSTATFNAVDMGAGDKDKIAIGRQSVVNVGDILDVEVVTIGDGGTFSIGSKSVIEGKITGSAGDNTLVVSAGASIDTLEFGKGIGQDVVGFDCSGVMASGSCSIDTCLNIDDIIFRVDGQKAEFGQKVICKTCEAMLARNGDKVTLTWNVIA
ncbi:MAG: hypothetical protein MJ025_02175 [Victivallaceae bacterium]|nr:hypothetical protein [Victivallaceae bacterium]